MERETLVLQDLTFQDCQETEEALVSQVPQVQSEPQDLPEGLDEMECQDCQVKPFTLISQLQLLWLLDHQMIPGFATACGDGSNADNRFCIHSLVYRTETLILKFIFVTI